MKHTIKIFEKFEDVESNWLAEAEESIKKHRMGEVKIKLLDKDGNAVSGAQIKALQKSHEFDFGANIFMLDELESDEKNRIYKERFKELFNTATLPFYWEDTEPEKGKTRYKIGSPKIYRRPPVELCLKYCEENGIRPREHGLAYESCFPEWLKGLSVEEVKAELEHHFKEIGELYSSKIKRIEVTNEMLHGKGKGVTPFYDDPDYVEWCFKTARRYFPDNEFIINDGDWRMIDEYCEYTADNIERDAPIDTVGIQFHLIWPIEKYYDTVSAFNLHDPAYVKKKLDMFEKLGKDIEMSEVTIPAFSNEPCDEEVQAKLIKYFYTLWFAQPKMKRIVYWNLIDGYAAFAPQGDMTSGENQYYGGLLRFDMSEKPAYRTLKKLIHETWHTEESLKTDENGELSFRGFYGDYEIIVNGKTLDNPISVSKNGDNSFVLII